MVLSPFTQLLLLCAHNLISFVAVQLTGKPSSTPTSSPSLANSPSPSFYPSRVPSVVPSSLPSLDPCKGYDGSFGNTTSGNELVISFTYGVESDKNLMGSMPASLSDQVKEVEESLLDLLIKSWFDHCFITRESRNVNIFERGKKVNHFASIASANSIPRSGSSGIVGIKSRSVDLANGGTLQCFEHYVILGCNRCNHLTLFFLPLFRKMCRCLCQ